MKEFSNKTNESTVTHVNPQTAAIMTAYGFSQKNNSFRWARKNNTQSK